MSPGYLCPIFGGRLLGNGWQFTMSIEANELCKMRDLQESLKFLQCEFIPRIKSYSPLTLTNLLQPGWWFSRDDMAVGPSSVTLETTCRKHLAASRGGLTDRSHFTIFKSKSFFIYIMPGVLFFLTTSGNWRISFRIDPEQSCFCYGFNLKRSHKLN